MPWSRTTARSAYMEYAKLHSAAKYNLATSGVTSYPLRELPVCPQDLEINGPTAYGYRPLQERLARQYAVAPECIVTAAGTSMANHLAMAASFDPGDEVLVEQPTYELLVSTARFLGAEIRRFPRRFEEGFRIDPMEIRSRLTRRTKLVILTNLHNPSSVLTDEETLRTIGGMAAEAGARVLVDEVYLDTVWGGARSSFHLGENFVVSSSLTKAYGLSGLRCGWILVEPGLAERIWRLNDLFAATPAHPADLLSVIALDHLPSIAACARRLLETNRRALHAFLDRHSDLEVVRPRFGTIVFPRLKRQPVAELCALLREKYETSVVPGKFFEMPQHFRIGIGGPAEMTATGLERLGAALCELGGG